MRKHIKTWSQIFEIVWEMQHPYASDQKVWIIWWFLQRIVAGWFPRHTPWPEKGKIWIACILKSHSFPAVYQATWFWARIRNYRLKVQKVGSQILRLNPPWINDSVQWLFSVFSLLFGIDLCAEVVGGM